VVPAYLANLTPYSAGAALLARGISLDFAGAGTINLPVVTAPALADFVQQGAPIPVVQGVSTIQATLTPTKFSVIVALTREMIERSPAEPLVEDALLQATGPALDRRLFDNVAAVPDVRPAGLRYNIAALTASTATVPTDAMQADLETLIGAVSAVANNSQIIVVCAPQQAVAIGLKTFGSFAYLVLPTSSLPTGTVLAIAARALVNASGDVPQIDTAASATLHMSDAPLPIASGGVMAQPGPVIASFQKDVVGLRLRWPLSWALRDSRALAWMQSVAW
jgi:hypothetical protein